MIKLDKDLIVLDLETSGTITESASVIQIGAVKCNPDCTLQEKEKFNLYIKPYKKYWSDEAEKIHGLSQNFLEKNGLFLQTALERFVDWVGKPKRYYIAQWSCGFDTDNLKNAFTTAKIQYPFTHRAWDIASITRTYISRYGFSTNKGCFECARVLGIDIRNLKNHDASDDAFIGAKCLEAVSYNVLEKTNNKLIENR